MKRIYLCGKISGMPWGSARAKFEAAEIMLSDSYEVVNPIKICSPDWSWEECMIVDFSHLIRCDLIYVMDNWKQSKGARIELAVAKELGIEIKWE